MERELIEMVIDDENSNGVDALSLVVDPATEDETILLAKELESAKVSLSNILSKQMVTEMAAVNEEKRLILGLVLSPNQKIPRRKKNGDMYDIIFKAPTVERASELYMMNMNQNSITRNHTKNKVKGVTAVQTWLVEDSKIDKSALYGKEYVAGSWAVVLKVHDKEKWEEYKETGTTNISLEGVFAPKKIETDLTAVDKLNYLKSLV